MNEFPALTEPANVDIIGDVHGCCTPLKKLLERMGYAPLQGVYQHPERIAVFVGDLIDRGPEIRETVELIYRMHQAGKALVVLGNHEYNAVRFQQQTLDYLRDEQDPGLPERLKKLMKETLNQFRAYPQEWQRYTDWFARLPLFIETGSFRVVHACWDDTLIAAYKQCYPPQGLTPEFIEASKVKGSLESRTVDRLTRGTHMPLPDGMQLESKDGFIRRFFRTKFWEESPKTYGDVVFQPDPLPYEVAGSPIQSKHQNRLLQYNTDAPPVFFGHYWLKGRPKPLQRNVVCLDYSAVNFGRLTAYRFDGEAELHEDHFWWVYVDRNNDVDRNSHVERNSHVDLNNNLSRNNHIGRNDGMERNTERSNEQRSSERSNEQRSSEQRSNGHSNEHSNERSHDQPEPPHGTGS